MKLYHCFYRTLLHSSLSILKHPATVNGILLLILKYMFKFKDEVGLKFYESYFSMIDMQSSSKNYAEFSLICYYLPPQKLVQGWFQQSNATPSKLF